MLLSLQYCLMKILVTDNILFLSFHVLICMFFFFIDKKWFDEQNKRRIRAVQCTKQYCHYTRADKSASIEGKRIRWVTYNQEVSKEWYKTMNLLIIVVVMKELRFKKLIRKKFKKSCVDFQWCCNTCFLCSK